MPSTIVTIVANAGKKTKFESLCVSNTGNTTIQIVVGEGGRNSGCTDCRWREKTLA